MRHAFLFLAALSVTACNRQAPVSPDTAPQAETPVTAQADPAPAADGEPPVAADPKQAAKQAALDYALAEDGYINDANGQWATTARANAWFGHDTDAPTESRESSVPWHATGAPNARDWTNNAQSVGMDWLELGYAAPVHATAVRVVMGDRPAVESLARIELVDQAGERHVVWSGVSDVAVSEDGPRTWFNKTFAATPYLAQGVRLTFANAVSTGYKTVDAVQLVGNGGEPAPAAVAAPAPDAAVAPPQGTSP